MEVWGITCAAARVPSLCTPTAWQRGAGSKPPDPPRHFCWCLFFIFPFGGFTFWQRVSPCVFRRIKHRYDGNALTIRRRETSVKCHGNTRGFGSHITIHGTRSTAAPSNQEKQHQEKQKINTHTIHTKHTHTKLRYLAGTKHFIRNPVPARQLRPPALGDDLHAHRLRLRCRGLPDVSVADDPQSGTLHLRYVRWSMLE